MVYTRRKLARRIGKIHHWPGYKVQRFMEAVVQELEQVLIEGHGVTLRGFGSFAVVDRPERGYHNPLTGKVEVAPARKAVRFTPSKKMLLEIKKAG